MAFKYIFSENKIRIRFSDFARKTIINDKSVFGVESESEFINTVFANFKDEAKSSISIRRKVLSDRYSGIDSVNKEALNDIIDKMQQDEKKIIDDIISQNDKYYSRDFNKAGKLYHIRKKNVDYLTNECNEDKYYRTQSGENSKPGQYIKYVIEEYCSLPFINRERIYKKELFEAVEECIKNNYRFTTIVNINGQQKKLEVFPYKILPDDLHTKYYLACYTIDTSINASIKTPASFNMARLQIAEILRYQTSSLTEEEENALKDNISKSGVRYLLRRNNQNTDDTQENLIKIRLTENGYRTFSRNIDSRPFSKNDTKIKDSYYIRELEFECSFSQILNYFLSFGKEALVVEPVELRKIFIERYKSAIDMYEKEGT